MNKITRAFLDSWVMFNRCLRISLRNPDTFASAIIVPAIVMWLFGAVFGNIMDVGDYSYIDFIVPGIILQTIGQGSISTAIGVNNDLTKGVIDRFRSMPITKSAVLTGHVLASVMRNIITTAVAIGVAFAIGFRPQAGLTSWLIIAGVMIMYMLAITWLSVIGGLLAKTPESAGSMLFLLFVLPYLSSGFVPVEALSGWLRFFATYQPMTPIIDTLRGLMLGVPVGNSLPISLAWAAGITVVAFVIAVQVYKRKLS